SELRKVIPKGSDLSKLTVEELSLACSHVNSYGRPNLGGQTPYALASMFLPRTLFEEFGIVAVPRDEVCLRPSLFAEAGLR
ncbi:MAG: hypothetical protein ACI4OC_01690, partial [Coriobacteriales bacterium]